MIIAPTDEGVFLRWREGEGEQPTRRERIVSFSDIRPYFFVKREDSKVERKVVSDKWNRRNDFTFEYEHDVAVELH